MKSLLVNPDGRRRQIHDRLKPIFSLLTPHNAVAESLSRSLGVASLNAPRHAVP